jgi:hypothetical protein
MVNKPNQVNIDPAVEARLRRIFEAVPGLAVQRVERPATDRDAGPEGGRETEPADAIVTLAGQRLPLACMVRTSVNAALAWAYVRWTPGERGARPLLVAEHTTAEAREIMRRHGAAYVDGAGFAHVELPGLFIHMEARDADRRRRPVAARGTVRLAGKAGVVAQALLLDPRRDWGVHALAQAAQVSPGLAHKVLQRLESDGMVASSGAGPGKVRRVADPAALLDVWAEEARDLDVVRTAAFRFARTPRELVWQVANGLDTQGIVHAVTGAAAAALLARQGAPSPFVQLWLAGSMPVADALRTIGAEPADREHNVVLCQARGDLPLAFRTKTPEGIWTVNPARLYVDLRADPLRGREQADEVRREVLRF